MTRTLTHDQQQAAALYLGIPLAALQAVQEVEARSHGFLACPFYTSAAGGGDRGGRSAVGRYVVCNKRGCEEGSGARMRGE